MKYISLIILLGLFACSNTIKKEVTKTVSETTTEALPLDKSNLEKAYFASGCFWCVEAVFQSVKGVDEAISGYAGGKANMANYRDVCTGTSGHAESVEVIYNPNIISYEELLLVFFDSHDPSTLNRQGPDSGTQYRSEIFYVNDAQKMAAEKYIEKLKKEGRFTKITTQVSQLEKFYPAEDYHQEYESLHPNNGYVKAVSIPRLNKFKAKHPELLK